MDNKVIEDHYLLPSFMEYTAVNQLCTQLVLSKTRSSDGRSPGQPREQQKIRLLMAGSKKRLQVEIATSFRDFRDIENFMRLRNRTVSMILSYISWQGWHSRGTLNFIFDETRQSHGFFPLNSHLCLKFWEGCNPKDVFARTLFDSEVGEQ